MEIEGRKITQINIKTAEKLLRSEARDNLLFYGNSGNGKSEMIYRYAEDTNKQVYKLSLAQKLPEAIGGIPHAVDNGYYEETLLKDLAPLFEVNGKDWIIFIDEINQGSQEIYNTLYGICDVLANRRNWCGHSLEYAHIIACGNLDDGSDGTVYLNQLPKPLHERFAIYELVADNKATTDYLKQKYKSIPYVAKYIRTLLEENISPRTADWTLQKIQENNKDILGIQLQGRLSESLALKLLDIQKNVNNIAPDQMVKNAKEIYRQFKQYGEVKYGIDLIDTDEELKRKLSEYLTDEEIKAVWDEVNSENKKEA